MAQTDFREKSHRASDLACIRSLISSVAVLISLVHLSLQLRQSERNQQTLIQQGRATRPSDLLLRIAGADAVEANYEGIVGDEDISLVELHQFLYLISEVPPSPPIDLLARWKTDVRDIKGLRGDRE